MEMTQNHMHRGILPTLLATLTLLLGTAQAADSKDKPLTESLERLQLAWNAGDGARWSAEYWPDCDFVNILGAVLPCPGELAATTTRILAGPFRGSHFEGQVRRVQFLAADIAIVDVDVRVTNFPALPPGAVATAPGLLITRLKHVFQRRSGTWKIVTSQNTAVAAVAMH